MLLTALCARVIGLFLRRLAGAMEHSLRRLAVPIARVAGTSFPADLVDRRPRHAVPAAPRRLPPGSSALPSKTKQWRRNEAGVARVERGCVRQREEPPRLHVHVHGRRRWRRQAADADPVPQQRLPPRVCQCAVVHAFCLLPVAEAGAVVLSAGYRLTLEKFLNATVGDSAGFLRELHEQSMNAVADDGWLAEAGNFGHGFVTGDSIDNTIAHQHTVRTDTTKHGKLDLHTVTVRGGGERSMVSTAMWRSWTHRRAAASTSCRPPPPLRWPTLAALGAASGELLGISATSSFAYLSGSSSCAGEGCSPVPLVAASTAAARQLRRPWRRWRRGGGSVDEDRRRRGEGGVDGGDCDGEGEAVPATGRGRHRCDLGEAP
ncbi:hypothetical protein HU200_044427 [Digitaria exilis]|uniref:Alpha/beta hydrolase fold-3 domain-containing protein n=1 Tax=Digitaria exilis TaxID=1010633 RepID=A0A835B8P1_9POAL|nr:hypothetical protein HU200_044427 [Digitaria exilis]